MDDGTPAPPDPVNDPPGAVKSDSSCEVFRLGLVSYEAAWKLQDRLAGEIARGERPPALLLLEHPHTYTFGRRGNATNLLYGDAELSRRGITVHWVDRGGDVTYHGPGQLVGYPLLPLAGRGWQNERLPQADFVGYIRRLEHMLIRVLAGFGIRGGQRVGLTGVWVPGDGASGNDSRADGGPGETPEYQRKIASIGVKVDVRGISRHGFALNVAPDMTYWEGIIACGLQDVPMVCMADVLNPVPSIGAVMDQTTISFGQVFSLQMEVKPCEEINPA
jgi:lipoate-protein ligase B